MAKAKVSIIIPAFNESQTIGALVAETKNLYPDFEVVVIDDHSTDNTAKVAKGAGAIVYSHPYNIGNGGSIKTGIRKASGKILVFMDGDAQHDPKDIKRLIEHFPEYDMVVGARQKGNQSSSLRAVGNKIYNWLARYVTKFPVQDLTSGFRAIKSNVARKNLYLLPNSYSYPTTITLSVIRSGRAVKYVPISIHKRKKGESKIRILKDGVRFILIIMKICTLYSPLRIFLPISLFMFLLGLAYYLYTYFTASRFTNMSLLLFTNSIVIFMIGLVSEQISQMRFDRSEEPK
jgi:glycosyltransferase involved in cell wall biosynthesis